MIYVKTELGQAALQNRASMLPRQRSAFILFDGKRSDEDVLKATAGLGVTLDDVIQLIHLGLLAPAHAPQAFGAALAPVSRPAPLAEGPNSVDGKPTASAQAHYSRAYPIATRLTAALGLRGFRLNLAVEAAGDLDKLRELAPRIKEAVGAEKFRDLEDALYD